MRFDAFKHNFKHLLIAFDQVLRMLVAFLVWIIHADHKGYADETLSAYAYRKSRFYKTSYVLMYIIDVIMLPFEKFKMGHCKRSFENEKIKKHLPNDYQ